MNKTLQKLINKATSYVPTKLPVGMAEFNTWADSIIELSGKFADEDSMKYAIASNLMHLPHTTSSVPKNYFVKALRKAAANQVASQVFMYLKIKQQEAAAVAQAEVTAELDKASSDGEKTSNS